MLSEFYAIITEYAICLVTKKEFTVKINNLYLPLAVFIVQVLVEPSKQLKQIIQIEHNIVKNPNWPAETSWLFTSVADGLNLGLSRDKSR